MAADEQGTADTRRNDEYAGRLPNFFLLGAAKAGTTSLYDYLRQHPEIYLPDAKEPHFFDYPGQYAHGVKWYVERYFRHADRFPARGEATPSYLSHPDVLARMRETYGDRSPRFLVLLRDPVRRAWSHFRHRVRNAEETLPFDEALAAERTRLQENPDLWAGYFNDGLYAHHLERWWRVFPRDAFLILWTSDLAADAAGVVRKVLEFLGVDPSVEIDVGGRKNRAAAPRSRALMRFIARPSLLRRIATAVVPRHVRRRVVEWIRSRNVRRDVPSDPIPLEGEDHLRERYAPDVRRLEELTGRELEAWRRRPDS